jgi:hypothetical protein
MRKNHYDGMKLCSLDAGAREYEIRGIHVFRPQTSPRPLYEICGRYIYECMIATQPLYRIDDHYVYRFDNPERPVFELRPS